MAKVVLLIGAGKERGVGAASARIFAQNGYHVALHCLKSYDTAVVIAEECRAYGVKAEIFQGDVRDPAKIQEIIQNTLEVMGQIDVVVYCAGFTQFIGYDNLNALNLDDFNQMFAVNCFGAYFAAASAKEALTASRGSFIAVSSAAGITGSGSSIAYAASKGALNTLILALSKALAPHVRVNAVAPSFIDSSWWDERFANKPDKYTEFKKSMADKTALGEVIKPEDLARCIFYLAENKLTGEVLRLDAGTHVK